MAATYTITNIVPRTRAVAGGTFTKVQEVTFTTIPSGLAGQVDIPNDDFSPDTVAAAVTPAAANLEAVKAL